MGVDQVAFGRGMGLVPESAGDCHRVDGLLLPPGSFIATSVQLMVMHPAERYGEAVADLAPAVQLSVNLR